MRSELSSYQCGSGTGPTREGGGKVRMKACFRLTSVVCMQWRRAKSLPGKLEMYLSGYHVAFLTPHLSSAGERLCSLTGRLLRKEGGIK